MEKAGGSPVAELNRWGLAERFGWTLDYIDTLSYSDLRELIAIDYGKAESRPKPSSQPTQRRR